MKWNAATGAVASPAIADDNASITILRNTPCHHALPDIIQLVNAAGVEIHSVRVKEPDLEAVFLALTGRALRD